MKKPFGKPAMDEEDPMDGMPVHEDAESPDMEQSEGPETAEGEEMPPGDPNATPEDDGASATPEEQEMKDKFVAQGMLLIYKQDKMYEKVKQMLAGGGDPVKGLATTTAMIVSRVYASADSSGIEMTADVVWEAGKELFEDLAEISRKAGIMDYSQDQDAFEGAFLLAADETRTMLQESGRLNKDAASADMATLKEMDDNGELEQKFLDLASKDDASGAEQEPVDDTEPVRGGIGKLAGVA